MENVKKYLLLAFLIENLSIKTALLSSLAASFFYMFLAIGALMLFVPDNVSSISSKRFGWMFILSVVYLVHCFVVGVEYFDTDNLTFLIAKIATFLIIITSLNIDFEFYEGKAMYIYAIIAALLLVYGILFSGQGLVSDGTSRSSFGFAGANSLGGGATIVFGIVLYEFRDRPWDKLGIIIVCVSLLAGLASGSRSSLIMMLLIYMTRYGLSAKSIVVFGCLFLVCVVIFPKFGVNLAGISRIRDTLGGDIGNNREAEREATKWMISEHPWTGWGLRTDNQGYALELSEMGSHNGYLDLAKTMGIPCAIIWLLIVISVVIKYLINIRNFNLPVDFFCVYAVCMFFKNFYEGMFAGVHEIECNMFFLSLAVLSKRLYDAKYS